MRMRMRLKFLANIGDSTTYMEYQVRSEENRTCGEEVPASAIEHAGIEVDTALPAVHTEGPLLVGKCLVRLVVSTGDLFPVVLGEEVMGFGGDLLKDIVGVVAGCHRLTEEILSLGDLPVAARVLLFAILLVSSGQLVVKLLDLDGATNQIVTRVVRLSRVGVKHTSIPLGRVTLLQINDVLKSIHIMLLEHASEGKFGLVIGDHFFLVLERHVLHDGVLAPGDKISDNLTTCISSNHFAD